jgi:hypothetical protein
MICEFPPDAGYKVESSCKSLGLGLPVEHGLSRMDSAGLGLLLVEGIDLRLQVRREESIKKFESEKQEGGI